MHFVSHLWVFKMQSDKNGSVMVQLENLSCCFFLASFYLNRNEFNLNYYLDKMFDGFSDKEKELKDYKLPVLGCAQVSTKFHKNC